MTIRIPKNIDVLEIDLSEHGKRIKNEILNEVDELLTDVITEAKHDFMMSNDCGFLADVAAAQKLRAKINEHFKQKERK